MVCDWKRGRVWLNALSWKGNESKKLHRFESCRFRFMKKVITIILLAILLLLCVLCSCERTLPNSNLKEAIGYMESKSYYPSYVTQEDNSSTIMVGEVPVTLYSTIDVFHPERYVVKVFYRNEKDELCFIEIDVVESFYNNVQHLDKLKVLVEEPFIQKIE